jgi:hypothetical protein
MDKMALLERAVISLVVYVYFSFKVKRIALSMYSEVGLFVTKSTLHGMKENYAVAAGRKDLSLSGYVTSCL